MLGVMLVGVSGATTAGFAGMVLYLFGHGVVKSVLFMVAGILPPRRPDSGAGRAP